MRLNKFGLLVATSVFVPLALAGCSGGRSNGGGNNGGGSGDVPNLQAAVLTSGNEIAFFNLQTPNSISNVTVSDLSTGEELVGLDFRFSPGNESGAMTGLYALARSDSNDYRLYTIDNQGVATPVGPSFEFPADFGTAIGFDFNPNVIIDGERVDRIRVVSSTGSNARLNPNTGAIVDSDSNIPDTQIDGDLAFAADDTNNGRTPRIAAAAYTNNDSDASTGTINYAIDSGTNSLVTQGRASVGGDAGVSPNTGQLFTVGRLGITANTVNGFDIATSNNYAAFVSGRTVYNIDLSTGRARAIGNLGVSSGTNVRGFTLLPLT